MRDHMRAELTIAAITMAIQRRRPGPGLIAYIEGYYNRQRIHSAIGYITPNQAEAISA